MEQDMLAGKLAEVDAQLAGVHAKLRSAAQMESAVKTSPMPSLTLSSRRTSFFS